MQDIAVVLFVVIVGVYIANKMGSIFTFKFDIFARIFSREPAKAHDIAQINQVFKGLHQEEDYLQKRIEANRNRMGKLQTF